MADLTPDDHEGKAQVRDSGSEAATPSGDRTPQSIPSDFGVRLTPILNLRRPRRQSPESSPPPGEG
jgi:hypothetical protein